MPTRIASAPPEPTDPADQLLDSAALPKRFGSVEELDNFLAMPSQALVDDLARARGDILILGVAGKMGPTLARMAKRAAPGTRVIGVARFSDPAVRDALDAAASRRSPPTCSTAPRSTRLPRRAQRGLHGRPQVRRQRRRRR